MNRGYLYIIVTNFFFAGTYLGTKYMFNTYPGLTVQNLSFWGLLAATCLFTPVIFSRKSFRTDLVFAVKKNGKTIVAISALSSVAAFLWFMALQQAGTGPVALIIKTTVIFSIFLGILFLNEKMGWLQSLGVAVAVCGLVLISTLKSEISLTAVFLSLASAFFFSCQSFVVKKFGVDIDGKSFAWLRALLMAIIFFIFFMAQQKLDFITWKQFLLLGVISGMGLIIGRTFFFQAHRYLDISKLSTIILLEPVIIMIGAYFMFGEGFSLQKVAGSAMILLGLYSIIHRDIKRK